MRLPRRMYWLADGMGRDCIERRVRFLKRSDTVLVRLVSAVLKDVDYLPMAKPESK